MAAPMQMQQNQQLPPPQHQQHQQQQQQQQQQNPQQVPQHLESDPVAKFKNLLPRLKESLVILFKAAGEVFRYHTSQDNGNRPVEKPKVKFEKCLEEFYALCDQIEMNLKSALEISAHLLDSMKHTPFPVVSLFKMDPPPEAVNYQQYLVTVRTQINYATEIHDVLTEFSNKLTEQSS